MFSRILSLTLLASAFFALGCETLPDTERPQLTEPFKVTQGTTAEEIITHLGEPDIKHPLADYSIEAEVWVFNRTLGSKSKSVFTGTDEQRYWDPIEKRMIVIEVPVYQPEVTSNVEVTEILLVKGRVYSWKRKQTSERGVNGLSR